MKKHEEKNVMSMSIDEVADLFKGHEDKRKAAEAAARPYRERLLEYAKDNPCCFVKNTLKFKNGVRVEVREGTKIQWNDADADFDWLSDAIDVGIGDAISVKIDHKKLPTPLSEVQEAILWEIGYKTEKTKTYALYLSR